MLQTLLQKRSNGYYYFRWVCPPAIRKILGKREIIKSLRTTSKIQALARAGAYYMAVDKLKEFSVAPVEDISSVEDGERELDRIRSSLYENVVVNCFADFIGFSHLYKARSLEEAKREYNALLELIDAHRVAATNYLGEYEAGKSIYDKTKTLLDTLSVVRGSEPLASRISSVLSGSEDLPDQSTYNKLESLYFDLFVDCGKMLCSSEAWCRRYTYELTQVLFRSYEVKKDKLDPSKAIPSLGFLSETPSMTVSVIEKTSKSLLLSELFEEFLAHKISVEDLSPKSQADHKASFPVLLHFIGDLPIADITSRKVKACLQACLKFPKRNLKPYKGKSVAEIAALDIPENHRLSPKSVENYKKLLQGIFAYARELEYIQQSPAVDLNLGIKLTKKKAAFSKSEVGMLLRAANALGGKYEERKWIVLLGAYTGARLSEITQLRFEDLKIDLDTGVRYLRITSEAGSVKTDNANRLVPVHSKLLELGFDAYADGVGDDGRLFPNHFGKSKRITSWFPSFVSELAIPKLNDLNQSRTFHSFRHSFITAARGAGQPTDLVQAIVGHEKTSAGMTDGYTGDFTVDELHPVVESIVYL